MVKTLTKHGNSLALVIDKPILELLNIDADTPLSITTDGKSLIIAPADPKRAKKLDAAKQKIMAEWKDVFKRLAE
jgi:antitoxin component of MazEF toxin-antitoxin module